MRITCNSHSNSYLYIFKHGIGPGTLPEGVNVVKTKDLPNYYTAVWLDRFLTTDEMKQYDIPFETDINYYLDRIGYCQKDGDVVPCDDVEACDNITASQRFEVIIKRYGEPAEEEVVTAESQQALEDKLNNDGYIDWWDYNSGKTYDPWETVNEDDHEFDYDDVEACDTVTAAKSSKSDILDSYVGEDIWLKAKLSQKAYFRRGYTGNEYWIRIVDKDEDGNYVINRVSSYKEYKGNSTQKQNTLSNTYTVDKNSITFYNPIQTATTDEIFSVEACDDVTASTIPTSDIEFLAKEALNCNTRDELGSVISSLQSIDKKLYLHYMELFRDNSLSVAYIASQLSDELMSYYVDDVEACNDVMASEDDEDEIYWVQAYYSKPHKGLADDFATNDWDAAIDKLVEFANQGYYIAFDNLASGDGRYYDPDEVFEAIDFGDIYELRGLANLCEG